MTEPEGLLYPQQHLWVFLTDADSRSTVGVLAEGDAPFPVEHPSYVGAMDGAKIIHKGIISQTGSTNHVGNYMDLSSSLHASRLSCVGL